MPCISKIQGWTWRGGSGFFLAAECHSEICVLLATHTCWLSNREKAFIESGTAAAARDAQV